MKINVKDLNPSEPRWVSRDERVEFKDDSIALAGPLVYELTVSLAGDGVLVQGKAEVLFRVHCHRCWKVFDLPRAVEVDEVLILGEEPARQGEEELHQKDFNQYVGPSGQIDLTDMVFQLLLLNLPSKLICSTDCQGGESHTAELKRSPFDVLKGLKQ